MSEAVVAGDGGGRERKGKLAGRSPAEVVKSAAEAGLPAELGAAVLGVTGKTRLWNSERTEVARELCSHFFDGLESGASVEELRGSFGDAKNSARLITRAKKRNRPLWWRASRDARRLVGLVFVLLMVWYGYHAARFYWGRPVVNFSVVSKINAPALAVPVEQRAWPVYRDAYRSMPKWPADPKGRALYVEASGGPAQADLATLLTFVRSARPQVERLRTAAAMERAAFVVPAQQNTIPADMLQGEDQGTGDPSGFAILLPQLGVYRACARVLALDCLRSASEGRGDEVVADVRAIMGISRHASEDGTIMAQNVGTAVMSQACYAMMEVVAWYPSAMSEAQMAEVIHALSTYRASTAGVERVDPSLERLVFDDFLQRAYTDNGRGNGHLTAAYLDMGGSYEGRGGALRAWAGPLLSGLVADRRGMKEAHDRVVAAADQQLLLPLHLRDRSRVEAVVKEVRGGVFKSGGAALVREMQGSDVAAQDSLDRSLMQRDAVIAGLACEVFKLRHGRYPAGWNELVPGCLPVAPVDRWTGLTMGYRADAGPVDKAHPMIYSVGRDRVDDGGAILRNGRDDGWWSRDVPLWPAVDVSGGSSGGGGGAFGFGRSWTQSLWGW